MICDSCGEEIPPEDQESSVTLRWLVACEHCRFVEWQEPEPEHEFEGGDSDQEPPHLSMLGI